MGRRLDETVRVARLLKGGGLSIPGVGVHRGGDGTSTDASFLIKICLRICACVCIRMRAPRCNLPESKSQQSAPLPSSQEAASVECMGRILSVS